MITTKLRNQGDHLAMAQQLEAVATRPDSLDDAIRRFEQWLREKTGESHGNV